MEEASLSKLLKDICGKDQRYQPGAYVFVLEALEYTARMLNRPSREGPERHISGQELLEGIRKCALEQFGPMTLTVLDTWGVKRTEDFGEIVFTLVEAGKLRKTEKDCRQDFAGGYDFFKAFSAPFLPRSTPSLRRGRDAGTRRKRTIDKDEPAPESDSR